MDSPELGPIGDLLVSSEFSKMVSVLVMQQYVITTPQPAVGPAVPVTDDPVRQYVTNAIAVGGSRRQPDGPRRVGRRCRRVLTSGSCTHTHVG